MTLAEAIRAFEHGMHVSAEVGYPDAELEGRANMSRAPTGERYVTMTGGGIKAEAERMPAYFASEDIGAEAWLRHALAYAEERGGKTIYWREQPTWIEAEYIALDQAGLASTGSMEFTLRIGVVVSRLLVRKAEKEA